MAVYQRFGRGNIGCGYNTRVKYTKNVYNNQQFGNFVPIEAEYLEKLEVAYEILNKYSPEAQEMLRDNDPQDILITTIIGRT